jgi:hypothetical protein
MFFTSYPIHYNATNLILLDFDQDGILDIVAGMPEDIEAHLLKVWAPVASVTARSNRSISSGAGTTFHSRGLRRERTTS